MVKLKCAPEYVCDVEELAPSDVQRLKLLEAAGGLLDGPAQENVDEIEVIDQLDAAGAASEEDEDKDAN